MGAGASPKFFTGSQKLATADDVEAFVRRAAAGQSFTYCEAPDLIRSETSAVVNRLAGDDLVRPHRRRRPGGGWEFFVVRTGKNLPQTLDPVRQALADVATDLIFRALKRAASFARPCPSDAELARDCGLNSRDQAQARVRKLVDVGLIRSTVAYEGGVRTRVVTIAATKHAGTAANKFTALPRKWAALREAAERELREADDAQMDRLRGAGL